MPMTQLTVIALIQGITEFLPISSSGHLVLIPSITGWHDQGLVIDVAVHIGTLGAVMAYLWRDIGKIIIGILKPGKVRLNVGLRLISYLTVATIPLVIAGGIVYEYIGASLRSAVVVGWATLGFGILLFFADRYSVTINRLEHMTITRAFIIGVAQILALIPGASRAGTTITMARCLGFERVEAARFSMLLFFSSDRCVGCTRHLGASKVRRSASSQRRHFCRYYGVHNSICFGVFDDAMVEES